MNDRCGLCTNCHKYLKEKAAYAAAHSEHPESSWDASWNARKKEFDEKYPCLKTDDDLHCG